MLKISAKHSQDLIDQLSNINDMVPERTQGRKTEHVELWTAIRFLATYANSNFLSYPIEIVHQDIPDFLIRNPNDNIGVEITESIPEQYANFLALAKKHFPNANIEPSMFVGGQANSPPPGSSIFPTFGGGSVFEFKRKSW